MMDLKLFRSGPDWLSNACVNFSHSRYDPITEGNLRAAKILVDHIEVNHRDQDVLVYPICFLFRHHIELRLKEIITNGRALLEVHAAPIISHDLVYLWKTARGICEEVWSDIDERELLDRIESIIIEFSSIDPRSTNFRYYSDFTRSTHLGKLNHINLSHLRDSLKEAIELLDGASCGISHYLDETLEAMANEREGLYV